MQSNKSKLKMKPLRFSFNET